MREKQTILVVGMGTSPAVLTETVWALAHQEQPVVPDEIEVITTSSGKSALQQAILEGAPSVMDRLKAALRKEKIDIDDRLVFRRASIKVIPDADGHEASDLRTGVDNLRAADFMLTPIHAKHSQKLIVSGSMRHAFLFADESENGCCQSLFYVRRTSQNGWSYGVLRRCRSAIRRGTRCSTVKNYVFHSAAAQRFGAHFTQNPTDSVRNVGLTASVRADYRRYAAVEAYSRFVREGFEPLHFYRL